MNEETILLIEKIKELEKENLSLKQQQIEISEAKELYLKIFEEFPALIWRSRLDKLCDYFNKTWLEFTGRTMEQEFGNGWAEGVHPDDFDACLNIYVTAFDKREAFLMEYRMKNKFGEYRWIRDFGRPFYDLDNSFLGYIGSCYDITEIKDNELRLIELNATKDKFFSIIAHDLKAPFNSILGFSDILVEEIKNNNIENVKDYTQRISQVSNQSYSLLTNLLEWSMTQTDGIKFKPEKVNFSEMSNELINYFKNIVQNKKIIINSNIKDSLELFADRNMLMTIIRNLVYNSIKFTPQKGEITISAITNAKETIISVKDTGVGIKAETIERLFKIEEDVKTLGTEKEKGTGLGLIICYDFVKKHNGKIWAESEVGKGSVFSFSIPHA